MLLNWMSVMPLTVIFALTVAVCLLVGTPARAVGLRELRTERREESDGQTPRNKSRLPVR